ncbi:hypothetical protein Hypma_000051 [Hypsizygus marmoreus]|uniref:Uncharacterized protein n=1 Tax=Hypsizygus marmoreus TaxID=39966 RepID=A0A369KH61_HYPMA|nr:hypothetical protein Hypma_000051 [Hypsizygus marmoreus]
MHDSDEPFLLYCATVCPTATRGVKLAPFILPLDANHALRVLERRSAPFAAWPVRTIDCAPRPWFGRCTHSRNIRLCLTATERARWTGNTVSNNVLNGGGRTLPPFS